VTTRSEVWNTTQVVRLTTEQRIEEKFQFYHWASTGEEKGMLQLGNLQDHSFGRQSST